MVKFITDSFSSSDVQRKIVPREYNTRLLVQSVLAPQLTTLELGGDKFTSVLRSLATIKSNQTSQIEHPFHTDPQYWLECICDRLSAAIVAVSCVLLIVLGGNPFYIWLSPDRKQAAGTKNILNDIIFFKFAKCYLWHGLKQLLCVRSSCLVLYTI